MSELHQIQHCTSLGPQQYTCLKQIILMIPRTYVSDRHTKIPCFTIRLSRALVYLKATLKTKYEHDN